MCKCGRVSKITEINSVPLSPLKPMGQCTHRHTSQHLKLSQGHMWKHGACSIFVRNAESRVSAACENSAGVWQWFTELPTEPPAVQRGNEGDDYWLWLMFLVVKWPVVMWRTQSVWVHYVRAISTSVIWENSQIGHASRPELSVTRHCCLPTFSGMVLMIWPYSCFYHFAKCCCLN